MFNSFTRNFREAYNKWQYDIVQDLWWAIQKSEEYIHPKYTLKYYFFEWDNIESDDVEEICDTNLFSIREQWDVSLPYRIWRAKNGCYVYFLIPTQYENSIWWSFIWVFQSKDLPVNIDAEVLDTKRRVVETI